MKLHYKIWILVILVLLSLVSIFGLPPKFAANGLIISYIDSNSSLYDQGLRQGDILINIDGQGIENIEKYSQIILEKFPSSENVKLVLQTNKGEFIFFGKEFPEMTVSKIKNTNIELGLDLQGGSRALIKAENQTLNSEEIQDLIDITANRFNAFGLTDLKVAAVSDLSGENFMLVEIAGSTPQNLRQLISEQGVFKAKIGEDIVFEGGSRDVASVSRDAQNSRIESCAPSNGAYYCRFSFAITLSPEAAKRHAEVTDKLEVISSPEGTYLSENLDLILDGNLVSSLLIGEGLKGQVTTQISISGSGQGSTEQEAYDNAKAEMKKLQTVLMTGSLPYKLEIVKLDTISPTLGQEFINTILLTGLIAILVVSIIIFVRYRSFKSSIAVIISVISEVIIILGIASMIRWNLDFPSIAGILATIGTGVDDLIIILDESTFLTEFSLKQRLKHAFSIIMGAYFTTFVSLLPLLWAGAGLLKGFAITTIIGISVGVFITRPAFSEMIKRINKN